ncbi:DUF2157 domain-containing protein [Gammaproteobacteria bacterium ESL0073]|nr:DUF2157 domain-containing protein [Gammaproteobacteria bacterium ESL0073]
MQVKRKDLDKAVEMDILSSNQAESLWSFLKAQNKDIPSFQMTHILYYFGGMIAISAMSLFMTLGWERFGGFGLFVICVIYATLLLILTEVFLRRQLAIPAGILATLVVVLVPLAVYGLQASFGYWDDHTSYRNYHRYIDWRWMIMELATLAIGVFMVYRYRLPFLVMPVAVTLWYMSMDLVPLFVQLFGWEKTKGYFFGSYWELKQNISLWFGLWMIAVAFIVDLKNRTSKDFSFWLYLWGVLAFWGALSSMHSDSELSKFFYCCINIMMIVIGAMISRKVFVVFGGLGVAFYLGHLSYVVFKDSMLFPFALTLIGLFIISMGIYWQRHEERIHQRLQQFLPSSLKALINKNN